MVLHVKAIKLNIIITFFITLLIILIILQVELQKSVVKLENSTFMQLISTA